jgi:hypothetical protein
MKQPVKILLIISFLAVGFATHAQRLKVGFTFQYLFVKQVKIDSDIIRGTRSYALYYARDNRWKFFGAGQSMVIGTVVQVDYKRFYFGVEPAYDLNTYHYTLEYPVSPDRDEKLRFQSLYFQIDLPFYLGYQFQSSNIFRYSVFAGGVLVTPYHHQRQFSSRDSDNPQNIYYNSNDLSGILFSDQKAYLNALAGFGIHFANIGKVDFRYQHRMNSPGKIYDVKFNTVGFALTYYLPVNLLNKKIYYED